MKTKVNYYYQQKFLPTKRHKKIKSRNIEDIVYVDYTELSKDEFPIAFIIHDMKSVQEGMKSYDDYKSEECNFRMFDEEIRTYKGKLYMPVRVTHGTAISTIFENESYMIKNLEYMATKDWSCENENEFSEESVVIEDNKKSIVQMLKKHAKKYIFCDGRFWHVCSEPRYVINTFGLGHNHGGTGFFIEYGYNSNISNKNYFNALQRNEAIAYGKSVAIGRGDTESVDGIGKYDNIEVIMPEMVKLNPKKDHGEGNAFFNNIEDIIQNSSDVNEAALLSMTLTLEKIRK